MVRSPHMLSLGGARWGNCTSAQGLLPSPVHTQPLAGLHLDRHGYDRSSWGSEYMAAQGFTDVNDIGGMQFLIPDSQGIDGVGFPVSTEPACARLSPLPLPHAFALRRCIPQSCTCLAHTSKLS